jgi:hypothetical protein
MNFHGQDVIRIDFLALGAPSIAPGLSAARTRLGVPTVTPTRSHDSTNRNDPA